MHRGGFHFRPWFFQVNYLVVGFVLIVLPFLVGFGKKPLFMSLMVLVAALMQFDHRRSLLSLKKPLELKLYTAWGFWALITGWFMGLSNYSYYEATKMLLRQLFVFWSAYAIFIRQRQHSYFYLILIVCAAIQVGATTMGFHLDAQAGSSVGGMIVRDVIDFSETRAEGLVGNANTMGFSMLAGVWACMMLWKARDGVWASMWWRGLILAAMAVFAYYAIQSGSRKTLMVMGVLAFGWVVWMIPGRFSVKSVAIALLLGIMMLLIAVVIVKYIMTETVLGQRFQEWFDAGGGSATEGFKENVRYWMYVDGFKFWLDNPIAGIGLGQFSVWHWSGRYSHSDYMEPLACTGLVGFILYQGYSLTVTLRLIKLLRYRIPPNVAYVIKGMLMFMFCNHYLIGLGGPHWSSSEHNLVVLFIGAYSIRMFAEYVKFRPLYGT